MRKPAPTADRLGSVLDRQIGELVAAESETGLPTDDTSVGDMSPLEAAILAISRDLANTLALARQIQEQGRLLETAARSLTADMDAVKAAVHGTKTRS